MIKKYFIIIPTSSELNPYCDYLKMTVEELARFNRVHIFYLNHFIKIWTPAFFQTHGGRIKTKEYVYRYSLQILPGNRFSGMRKVNQLLNIYLLAVEMWIRQRFQKTLFWCFYPHMDQLISYFPAALVVYDIIDYYTDLQGEMSQQTRKSVKYLLQRADVVTAISEDTKEKYQRIFDRPIEIVPQGFSLQLFENFASAKLAATQKKNTLKQKQPIIGLVGMLCERIDSRLLLNIAKAHRDWRFRLVGLIQHEPNIHDSTNWRQLQVLLKQPNVEWLPAQPKQSMPKVISQFDICIIPYDTRFAFNIYSYPMKIFEYLYLEKPVVATPIRAVMKIGEPVRIGRSAREWQQHIESLCETPLSAVVKCRARALAMENAWKKKIEKISVMIEEKATAKWYTESHADS